MRLRSLLVPTAGLALALTALAVVDDAGPLGGEQAALAAAAPAPTAPDSPTRFRVSTFNLLGYGHTDDNGPRRKGYQDGRTRQKMANTLIVNNNLDIVGFQEMEWPQIDQFKIDLGARYDIFPGRLTKPTNSVDANSIAWRRDHWTAVEKRYYAAPYFKGSMVKKPIVVLQHNVTGQRVIVTNTHNPANTFGNAKQWRDQSVAIQAATFTALRSEFPGVPILFTGDMNDRDNFFCPFVRKSGYAFQAANGGVVTPKRCTLPSRAWIDWIMGTNDITFSGYQQLRTPYIKKTTDHPLIFADVTLKAPLVQASGIRRVVVLDVEGLPAAALSTRYAAYNANLRRIAGYSAGTLNARTSPEATTALPNLVSLLTGRFVNKAYGGHATKGNRSRTIARAHGGYVRSVFDMVHDWGGSTSFMSSDRASEIVIRSYTSGGATDKQGVNYGKSKLSVSSIRRTDGQATKVIKSQLAQHPRTLSVVQYSGLRTEGVRSGFLKHKYLLALRRLDRQIGQVFHTITSRPALARSTMLVVTGDSGGAGRNARGNAAGNFTVPFLVWGNTIPGGQDLYALNPDYRDPGTAQIGFTGPQPVRPAMVANLVTYVLGLPPVPGSRLNAAQDLSLFVRR